MQSRAQLTQPGRKEAQACCLHACVSATRHVAWLSAALLLEEAGICSGFQPVPAPHPCWPCLLANYVMHIAGPAAPLAAAPFSPALLPTRGLRDAQDTSEWSHGSW